MPAPYILVGTTVLSGRPNWELQANVLWGKQRFGNNFRGVGGVGVIAAYKYKITDGGPIAASCMHIRLTAS